ncbi:MAG: hypothetical protein ACRC11_15340 [Xenococcaceae cyanobacterium]
MELINGVVTKEASEINTRYGQRLYLKVKSTEGEEITIWGTLSDQNLRDNELHERVMVFSKPKGGYALVTHQGKKENGFKSVAQVLSTGVARKAIEQYSNGYYDDFSAPSSDRTVSPTHEEAWLPILTDKQRRELKNFIDQRARIMAYIIKAIKRECGEDAFNEVSLKSIALSVYIDITKQI